MKYIEQLELAKKEKLNITKLFIAYEMEALLGSDKNEISEDKYEELCSIVHEHYLNIDYSSINDVAQIVYDLYLGNQKISESIIREKLETMYL